MQKHYLGLDVRSFLASQVHSIYVAALCGMMSLALQWATQAWPAAWVVLAAGLLVPTIWLMSIWVFSHPLRQEIEVFVKRYPAIARRLGV
jgi:ABC-type bacteriocin/lantibiotic exporter with double-glycine peptidase domain